MKLLNTMAAANRGRSFSHIGTYLGIDENAACDLVKALLPCLLQSFRRWIGAPRSIDAFIDLLGQNDLSEIYNAENGICHPWIDDFGTRILEHMTADIKLDGGALWAASRGARVPANDVQAILPKIVVLMIAALARTPADPLHRIVSLRQSLKKRADRSVHSELSDLTAVAETAANGSVDVDPPVAAQSLTATQTSGDRLEKCGRPAGEAISALGDGQRTDRENGPAPMANGAAIMVNGARAANRQGASSTARGQAAVEKGDANGAGGPAAASAAGGLDRMCGAGGASRAEDGRCGAMNDNERAMDGVENGSSVHATAATSAAATSEVADEVADEDARAAALQQQAAEERANGAAADREAPAAEQLAETTETTSQTKSAECGGFDAAFETNVLEGIVCPVATGQAAEPEKGVEAGRHLDLESRERPKPNGATQAAQTTQAAGLTAPGEGFARICQGMELVGNIKFEGELRIEGDVRGDVSCARLIVERTARILGDARAAHVEVRGFVEGSIRGREVILHGTANVLGDVRYRAISIRPGAVVRGQLYHTEADPLSEHQSAPPPPDEEEPPDSLTSSRL